MTRKTDHRTDTGNAEQRLSGLDRQALAQQLLRDSKAELARLRMTRGAAKRTSRRIRQVLGILALAAALLGVPLAAPTGAAMPVFVSTISPFGLGDVGRNAKPALGDIDGDGDLDLLVGNYDGDTVFLENTGTAAAPAFAPGTTNPFGLTNVASPGYDASPALGDIDGDGDLDLLVGDFAGNTVFFANTGTVATPAFAPPVTNAFGLANAGGSGASPALVDIDGDGDLDLFLGTSYYGDILFFANTGTANVPAFDAPATNPFGLTAVTAGAPTFLDIEGDGDLDLLVGDVDGDLALFRNIGTPGDPAFATAVTNPFGLTDVGVYAAPAFGDIDGDGDPDAFVGELSGNMRWFANTASVTPTSFATQATNPFGLVGVGAYASPSLGDIDGDGDPDAFLGGEDGQWHFAENTGSASAPAFATTLLNPFGLTPVGTHSTPALIDIDDDGDLDAFLGNYVGTTRFLENTGSPSVPVFAAPVQNPFGVAGVAGGYARHAFGDLDDDGDLDLLIGRGDGNTQYFANVGTASAPAFDESLRNPFGLVDVGTKAKPVLVDVEGDGDLDVLMGNGEGDLLLFANTGTAAAPAFAAPVTNPVGLSRVVSAATPAVSDIDADGDLDLLVGNQAGDTIFFERLGARTPTFVAPPPNPLGITNVGSRAEPELADIDGDGDPDAFVGNGAGDTFVFENTGTASNPAFASPSLNPFGLGHTSGRMHISLADMDADQDLDAVTWAGNKVRFQQNIGTESAPTFDSVILSPFGLPRTLSFADSAVELVDVDGDGDLDATYTTDADPPGVLLLENTGSASAPAFGSNHSVLISFLIIESSVVFGDIDGDGDLDAVVGGDDIHIFENVGTTSAPAFAAPRINPFGLVSVPSGLARPELIDIDDDGDLDLLAGSGDGDVYFFENIPVPEPSPSPPPSPSPTPSPSPSPLPPCPPVREPACTTGFESAQLVVNEKRAGKETLLARLAKGPALEQTDFGNPLVSNGAAMALCLYDDRDEHVATLAVDRAGDTCGKKPCWKHIGGEPPNGKGHRYRDGAAAAAGVVTMRLKGGDAGKSSIVMRARNNAPQGQTALPTGVIGALAGTTRIEMQLRTSEQRCFAATLDEVTEKNGVLKGK